MNGVDVGRDVDLAALNSYDNLLVELEKLFLIEREVRPMNKWQSVLHMMTMTIMHGRKSLTI